MENFIKHLRKSTKEEHQKTEALVGIPNMMRGEYGKTHYLALLRTHYRLIKEVLAGMTAESSPDIFAQEIAFLRACLQHLTIDFAELHADSNEVVLPGVPEDKNTKDGPTTKSRSVLTGELYVVLGATQGAKHIFRALSNSNRHSHLSLNYYRYCKEQPPTLWPAFLDKITRSIDQPGQYQKAVRAARDSFDRFRWLFTHFSFRT